MPVTTSSAPNSPSDRPQDDKGELIHADGYSYWASAEEESESTGKAALAAKALMADKAEANQQQKKGPRRPVVLTLLLLLFAVIGYFGVSLFQVYDASSLDQKRTVDAIVVLGAAQYHGDPSPAFAGRLDHAYDLWQGGIAELIITTGSKLEDDTFTEGFTGYVYLREQGVPDDALITIVDGRDTWEQLSATANQLNERDLSSVLLVSDGYHSYRLLDIADEFGIDAYVAPTGAEASKRDYVREAVAVSVGRIIGYDRISALNN